MTMIHQELGAVFFWRDGIIVDFLKHLSIHDIDLITTRRPLVGAHLAADLNSRFLAQRFQLFPQLRRNRILQNHALHNTAAVAQLWKQNLAARTQVVNPTLERYLLANVMGKLIYV